MRALTVRQPWAAAIAHGAKNIENRPKPIPPAHLGTTILIHAGVGRDENALPQDMIRQWPRHSKALIAVATLASSHHATRPNCCTPWGFPQADSDKVWHWVLENVRPIPHPILGVRGQLGLWAVPAAALAAVNRQVDLERSSL
ncbi:hypothetical protein [Streptomyces sp. NPDC060001]|uniref:hypothetical protein n=1 Tax=Streptomyces sp. NPDC060001 TaxID=3347032 RepID=UPI0036762F9E